MKIRYIGHSCFLLASERGTKVVTDPFSGLSIPMPALKADAVTLSHNHYDHANAAAVEAPVYSREGNFAVGDIRFSARKHYHDEVKGKKRGENLVFYYEIDGITVCHLGDIGEPYYSGILNRADVLLIPVGGNYTIDAKEAERYVAGLKPAVVIPMHFLAEGIDIDIAPPEAFLRSQKNVERKGESEITLTSDMLISKETKTVLLSRWKHE